MSDPADDFSEPVEKTFVRSLRIRPSVWAEVQARAERAGMDTNSYVVWACSRAPERSETRDERRPVVITNTGHLALGTLADVRAAAEAVVEDDGAALLDMAENEALLTYGDVATKIDPVALGTALMNAVVAGAVCVPFKGIETFPCGHARSPENSRKRGGGRVRCKICHDVMKSRSRG